MHTTLITLLLLIQILLNPFFVFSQDSTLHAKNGFEWNVSSNLLIIPGESRPQIFIASGLFYCHHKTDIGLTYYKNTPYQFDDNDGFYGVDSGYGFSENGLRFSVKQWLTEKEAKKNRFSLDIGFTYLWGKISYDNLKSPSSRIYAVRNKGAIIGTGISYYKKITGPLWLTSTVNAGMRLVSMKKKTLSLNDSRQFLNVYTGIGIACRF